MNMQQPSKAQQVEKAVSQALLQAQQQRERRAELIRLEIERLRQGQR